MVHPRVFYIVSYVSNLFCVPPAANSPRLGKVPVNHVKGNYQHRYWIGNFGQSWFGKCAYLHCFLTDDTLVLDSDCHWVFGCPHVSDIRSNALSFSETIKSTRGNITSLTLMTKSCANFRFRFRDFRIGFSLARSSREKWLDDVRVGGPPLCASWQMGPRSL